MNDEPALSIPLEPSIDIEPLRDFVRSEILARPREEVESGRFPIEIFRKLHELGWLTAFLPRELGGGGLATTDLVFLAREVAYGSAGIGTSCFVNVLCLTTILEFGSRDLQERVCRDFAENFGLCAYGMTEPDAGSNIFATRTTATRVPGGYRVSGRKCFITNANHARHLLVYATLEGAANPELAATLFYVPADSPGVSHGAPMKKLGQTESDTGDLYFDDVFVPEDNRVGAEGQGMEIQFRCLQRPKLMIGAGSVGICHRAADLAVEYLSNRKIYFRQSLLKLQTIHSMLAQWYTRFDAAWLLACRAAALWDTGSFAIKEASMAKMYGADVATRFVSEALELCGGHGYSQDCELERLYRDVKVGEIYEGPTLVQQLWIAKELFPEMLGRPISVRRERREKLMQKGKTSRAA